MHLLEHKLLTVYRSFDFKLSKSPSLSVNAFQHFCLVLCDRIDLPGFFGAVDETRNIEYPGTLRNIPEHGIIIIIMKKICKIMLSKPEKIFLG